jgi:hypothetical protein
MTDRLPLTIPLGGIVRFFGALPGGKRSASTWFVRTTRSKDIYFASTQTSSCLKTSLHQSGRWQTSFVKEQTAFDLDGLGLTSRHLDRWDPPAEFLEGMRLGLTLVIPWTQLLLWNESVRRPSCRLMMEERTALHVHLVLTRPMLYPSTLSVPDSAVFAVMDLGDGQELILLSRKVEWPDSEEAGLQQQIAEAPSSAKTFVDPRPLRDLGVPTLHLTRTTMFRTGPNGERFVVDAFDRRPFSQQE